MSIGCTNVNIRNNLFEGRSLGFEISQEYYKVSNGINNHIVVAGNTIKAKARGDNRGVIDIRHARNIKIKKNYVTSIFRDKTAYVSLASCQNVEMNNNRFSYEGRSLPDLIYKTNVPDPETGKDVPELNLDNLTIQRILINR